MKYRSRSVTITPLPYSPTVKLGTLDRVVTKSIPLQLPEEPKSDGERDLAGDAFASLHKQEPTLFDQELTPPARLVNRALMDWVMKEQAWKETREYTRGKPASAAGATMVLYAAMLSDEAISEALKRQEEAEQKEEQAKQMMEDAQDEEQMQEAIQKMQEAMQAGQEAAQGIQRMQEDPIKGHAAELALEEAKDEGQKIDALCKSWGIEQGEMQPTDIQAIMDLVGNSNFTNMAQMLGRLTGIAASTINDVKNSSFSSVSTVDMTREVSHVFPTERAYLSPLSPIPLRVEKLQNLLNGAGLLGWKPIESQKQSGSFIMFVDESGSMGKQAVSAAKALAMGIAWALQDDDPDRTYQLYGFSSKLYLPGVERGDGWKEHVNWAQQCANGGTNFRDVFEHAIMELTALTDRGVGSADFVFLTDGICDLPETTIQEWEELKTQISTRLVYLRIGSAWGSDRIEEIADLKYLDITPGQIFNDCERLCADIARVIAEHAYVNGG